MRSVSGSNLRRPRRFDVDIPRLQPDLPRPPASGCHLTIATLRARMLSLQTSKPQARFLLHTALYRPTADGRGVARGTCGWCTPGRAGRKVEIQVSWDRRRRTDAPIRGG